MILLYLVTILCALVRRTEEARDRRMDGRHFKSAVFEQPTAMRFLRDSTGSVIGYSGINYEIFDWLSLRLNFTYTLVPVFQYVQGPLPNGSWIGFHDLIRRKKVDFVSCGILFYSSSLEFMDMAATTAEIPASLLVPYPREESRFLAPIKPFSLTVWISILSSGVILGAAFYILYKLEWKIVNLPHSTSMEDIAITIVGVTFGQIEFPIKLSRTIVIRIVQGVFCLTALVVVNSYTSIFISFASTPKLVPLAENMDDMAFRSSLRYIGTKSQSLAVFKNSSFKAMRIFGDHLMSNPQDTYPSLAEAAEKVATGCCGFLYPSNVLEAWLSEDVRKTGQCRCTITKKAELVDFYFYAGQKGSPYVKILAKEMMEAKQMGLFDYWWRSALGKAERCLKPGKSQVRPLKFYDLSGVFLLFGAGVLFSFLVFIIEIARGTSKRANRARTPTSGEQ